MNKRMVLTITAAACWVGAGAVIVGTVVSEEIAAATIYGRLCTLFGLVAAVITTSLLSSRRVVHVPIVAETVYGMALQTGVKIGEMKAAGCAPKARPFSQEWAGELVQYEAAPPADRRYN